MSTSHFLPVAYPEVVDFHFGRHINILSLWKNGQAKKKRGGETSFPLFFYHC